MDVNVDLPNKLDLWTLDTVMNLVNKHEFEPGIFDYKDALNPSGPEKNQGEHLESIRRTVCSMANTNGGFILFGVRDRKKSMASPEDRLIGISVHGELLKQFGDKIANLQPEIYFEAIPRPLILHHDSSKGIFIVYIPKSSRRPHQVLSTGIYYKRGENGSAIPMNHYEVRDQMINTEDRLRKVTLFRLEILQYQRIIKKLLPEWLLPKELEWREVYVGEPVSLLAELMPSIEKEKLGNMDDIMKYFKSFNDAYEKRFLRFDISVYKVLLADICSLLPSSTNLLQILLEIPICASLANESIPSISTAFKRQTNLQRFMTKLAISRDEMMGYIINLRRLFYFCVISENKLSEIFGTLWENNP